MEILPTIIVAVVCIAVAGVLGALFGWNRRKSTAEREIGSAEEEAKLLNSANALKNVINDKQTADRKKS